MHKTSFLALLDACAFGTFATRTYYRRMTLKRRDWLLIPLYWLLCVVIIALLLWHGQFVMSM